MSKDKKLSRNIGESSLYVYFDARLMSKKRERKAKRSERMIVTFAPLTYRIYVSTGVFHSLDLGNKKITIVMPKEGDELFLWLDDVLGFELEAIKWSYYINSRETVKSVVERFCPVTGDDSKAIEFEVAKKTKAVDGKQMYPLTLLEKVEPNPSEASKLLEYYRMTDFPGRIKTQEIQDIERRLGKSK